jgi:hypothetical protein
MNRLQTAVRVAQGLAVAVVSALAAGSADAENQKCQINLTVIDAGERKPLPGAEVRVKRRVGDAEHFLIDTSKPAIQARFADSAGRVQLGDLDCEQSYYLETVFPGFAPNDQAVVWKPDHSFSGTALLQEIAATSLLQLISNPERWNGKQVRVIGYLRLEFEGNAIYAYKEDAQLGRSAHALWIDTNGECSRGLSGKYVLVAGKFDGTRYGHLGGYPGTITQINRCEEWK